ncbi:MAG: glycosyltransferase family 39 protein [Elusimicrobiales bacterium]
MGNLLSYRRSYFLGFVFFLALLVRFVFALALPHTLAPDSLSWLAPARDLAGGLGFTSTLRHPGYIALLASVFSVAGSDNLTAVRLVQSLLGGVQVLLLFFLALKIFRKEAIACLSALFLALYPYAIFQTSEILSESFNSFLLVLFFLFLYSALEQRRKFVFSVLAGAVFAATILTKSTIIVIVPFIFAFFHFNRVRYRFFAVFLAAAAVVLLPWTLRNYNTYGKFVLVNLSGSAIFQHNNPMTLEIERQTRDLKEVKWETPECLEIGRLPPLEADKVYRQRAWRFMRTNPGTVLAYMKMRFTHFWSLYPITHSRIQKLAALLTSGVYIPLALLGLLLSAGYWKKTFLIWATIFSYNAIHLVFTATLRYRIPLDPFFMIFAAFSMVKILELYKARGAGLRGGL